MRKEGGGGGVYYTKKGKNSGDEGKKNERGEISAGSSVNISGVSNSRDEEYSGRGAKGMLEAEEDDGGWRRVTRIRGRQKGTQGKGKEEGGKRVAGRLQK